jgi:hypothetical protein
MSCTLAFRTANPEVRFDPMATGVVFSPLKSAFSMLCPLRVLRPSSVVGRLISLLVRNPAFCSGEGKDAGLLNLPHGFFSGFDVTSAHYGGLFRDTQHGKNRCAVAVRTESGIRHYEIEFRTLIRFGHHELLI